MPDIAAYLREQGIAPELILCSSSRRTRETLDLIGPAFEGGGAVRVEIERGLYATSAAELLARIRRAPDDVSELMLINHQPAIQELALTLATGEQTELDRLAGKFPTAALATLAIEGGWSRLGPRSARLLRFVKPRELERPGA